MTINQLLQKLDTASPILQATFGLERENLRVTADGRSVPAISTLPSKQTSASNN